MRFVVIDHNDDTGRPHARQVAERPELIEAYDRLGAGRLRHVSRRR